MGFCCDEIRVNVRCNLVQRESSVNGSHCCCVGFGGDGTAKGLRTPGPEEAEVHLARAILAQETLELNCRAGQLCGGVEGGKAGRGCWVDSQMERQLSPRLRIHGSRLQPFRGWFQKASLQRWPLKLGQLLDMPREGGRTELQGNAPRVSACEIILPALQARPVTHPFSSVELVQIGVFSHKPRQYLLCAGQALRI